MASGYRMTQHKRMHTENSASIFLTQLDHVVAPECEGVCDVPAGQPGAQL